MRGHPGNEVLYSSRLNGCGFVEIFTGQILSENHYQIIHQNDDKDLLDYHLIN